MKLLAIDCEMVGDVSNQAILARVSIVDDDLDIVYDTFVKPTKAVHYYRDTGITDRQLEGGRRFQQVQADVLNHLRGSVLVGHSLDADLRALGITHGNTKDVADQYKQYGQRRSLKDLAWDLLNERIQTGPHHCSVEDARAAMKIYKKNRF